jgi:hypothetical protein
MQTQVLPAYLYQQYTQDPYSEDLQAFFTAYNIESQTRLDATNNLNLPIYTSQSAPLLDWTVYGIYGYTRPTLGTPNKFSSLNVYNTVPYNTIAYSQDTEIAPSNYYTVSDDVFKRIVTWNFYKGDGFQFNCQWLKRRIKRFLFGYNGIDFPIDNTYEISVSYGANNVINIFIPHTSVSGVFESALLSGVLNVPFEYTYTIALSGTISWLNNSSATIGWKNNSNTPITWFGVQ